MKKTIGLLIWLIFYISLCANSFFLKSHDSNFADVEFKNPQFELDTVDIEGLTYHKIVLKQDATLESFTQINTPDLPSFSKLIEIPSQVKVELNFKVTSWKTINNIKIAPSRNLTDLKNNITTYNLDPNRYLQSEDSFKQVVEISETGIMRDYCVARIIVNPYQYNTTTEELKIAENIEICLKYDFDANGKKISKKGKKSYEFEKFCDSMLLRTSHKEDRVEYQKGTYLFLYNGNQLVERYMQPLIDWKHRMGYDVAVVNTSNFGNDTHSLLPYLRNIYQEWDNPPEYICLVGDATGDFMVPTFYEYYEDTQVAGDVKYTYLDGGDDFPDAVVGRLSFDSSSQLRTIVNKTINYESNPDMSDEWLNNITLVGDPNSSGVSTITTMLYIKELYRQYNDDALFYDIFNSPFANNMTASVNNGIGALFYRGYYGTSGWEVYSAYNLNNTNRNPFMTFITCFSGAFADNEESLIEALLRAGTPSEPVGAVATIGSSSQTHTCFNNLMTATIAHALYAEGIPNIGGAMNKARLAIKENYPTNPASYVDWWAMCKNLMGDPGLNIWKKKPESICVTYNNELPLGTTNLTISVMNDSREPIPNAWVTLLMGNDNIFTSAYTDDAGNAELLFNADSLGTALITVTGDNIKPYLDSLHIVNTNNQVSVLNIVDSENLICGFDGSFNLEIKNYSPVNLTNISSILSTDNQFISMIDSISTFNNLNSNQIGISNSEFSFNISSDYLYGDEVVFTLTTTDGSTEWISRFNVEIAAPELCVINSNSTNNTFLQPGETAEVLIKISNTGSASFYPSNATIETDFPYVEIINDTSSYDRIFTEENNQNRTPFIISFEDVCIGGSDIPMVITLTDSLGVERIINFDLILKNPGVNDPTGSDGYGYYCYDDSDTSYIECPEYNWIEIDPDYGGSGSTLTMDDSYMDGSGDMQTVDLPFVFKFYGKFYSKISISSNGYIIPGEAYTYEWMNWSIPGPFVPFPIIAPFWDDLLVIEGNVCYYHNPVDNTFIIEWSRLNNRYNNAIETFQAILYDYNMESTNLGDSKIKFQYHTINNVDYGTYGVQNVDHGEYATVGIADHTSLYGLEYTYSNSYPNTAKHLEDDMAIMFSGATYESNQNIITISEITINDPSGNNNQIPDIGETIDLYLSFINQSDQIQENITFNLSTSDEYITLQNSSYSLSSINPNTEIQQTTPFTLSISSSTPNNHIALMILQIELAEETYFVNIPLRIIAPDINIKSYTYYDDENSFLGAGDSGTLEVEFQKNSVASLVNCDVNISTDNANITISPSQISISDFDETITYSFNISANEDLSNGDIANIIFDIDYGTVSETEYIEFYLGNPLLFYQQDFASTAYNWEFNAAYFGDDNLAGGTNRELILEAFSFDATAISPNLLCNNALKFLIKFKYYAENISDSYGLKMYGETFDNVIWVSSSDSEADSIELEVIPPTYAGHIRFEWFLNSDFSEQLVAIDDIEIYALYSDFGTVEGQVTLLGGDGNIEEVVISNGNQVAHPNNEGFYSFSCPPGTQEITASLDGYVLEDQFVTIVSDEIETIDFNLEYIPGVDNITYELNGSVINIDWDHYLDDALTRSCRPNNTRELDFRYFRIRTIFIPTGLMLITNSQTSDYERYLYDDGEYQFVISACYYGNHESIRDTLSVDFVDNNDQLEIPKSFSLSQNYPNPFSLSGKTRDIGTKINFDLPEDTNTCLLKVYNIKGELVRTLNDEPQKAGSHTIYWDGKNNQDKTITSGIYFYKLITDKNKAVKKAVLLK